jgi:hypothetical protein
MIDGKEKRPLKSRIWHPCCVEVEISNQRRISFYIEKGRDNETLDQLQSIGVSRAEGQRRLLEALWLNATHARKTPSGGVL